jgi:hypothetical protein
MDVSFFETVPYYVTSPAIPDIDEQLPLPVPFSPPVSSPDVQSYSISTPEVDFTFSDKTFLPTQQSPTTTGLDKQIAPTRQNTEL